MTEPPASDRYRVVVDEARPPKRWLRSLGVLLANVTSWFDGYGAGPTNPGGRTIKVVDRSTGKIVLEFVEGFGDDERTSLSMLQHDLESQTVGEFTASWL